MDIREVRDKTHESERNGNAPDTPQLTGQAVDSNVSNWREELAHIAARLEELNIQSVAQSSHLQRHVAHEIMQMRAVLRRLDTDVASVEATSSAHRIAARLEALQVQSDAAYVRLQASLAMQYQGRDEMTSEGNV